MTDFLKFLDFNALSLLYQLGNLSIIFVIGLSFSGCAAAPPEEPARAVMRNLDLRMAKLEICKKYKLFLGDKPPSAISWGWPYFSQSEQANKI